MKTKWLAGLIATCLFASLSMQAVAVTVAFVNPGKKDEIYWLTATQAMQSAADSLGMQLEVFYAERDHLRQVDIVRMLAERPARQRPDYVVIGNEKRMGGAQLKIATDAGIKVFFAYSTILPEDRAEFGGPREKYKLWVGSLLPRAEDAGYLTAKALIARGLREKRLGADGKLHLLAIAGDRSTESSLLRNAGMERAVKEQPLAVIDQTVYADWRRDLAEEKAQELFVRYPAVQLVWAGNDLMAFGAMQALEKKGGQPGRDKLFSGVNTSAEAMHDIIGGRMEALAGGHFMCGAWALVMLYDHAHGRDFAGEGLELVQPMFSLFDPPLARRFLDRFKDGVPTMDFRHYSKVLNPRLKRYDFSFAQLLKNDAAR
jgi:ABC-type sugar transport system substrate-binding protein